MNPKIYYVVRSEITTDAWIYDDREDALKRLHSGLKRPQHFGPWRIDRILVTGEQTIYDESESLRPEVRG